MYFTYITEGNFDRIKGLGIRNRPFDPTRLCWPNFLTEVVSLACTWRISLQTFSIHVPIQVPWKCCNPPQSPLVCSIYPPYFYTITSTVLIAFLKWMLSLCMFMNLLVNITFNNLYMFTHSLYHLHFSKWINLPTFKLFIFKLIHWVWPDFIYFIAMILCINYTSMPAKLVNMLLKWYLLAILEICSVAGKWVIIEKWFKGSSQ